MAASVDLESFRVIGDNTKLHYEKKKHKLLNRHISPHPKTKLKPRSTAVRKNNLKEGTDKHKQSDFLMQSIKGIIDDSETYIKPSTALKQLVKRAQCNEFNRSHNRPLAEELKAKYDPDGKGHQQWPEFYNPVSLLRRESLRFDPEVMRIMKSIWKLVDADGSGELDFNKYREYHSRLIKILTPGCTAHMSQIYLLRDWRRDVGSKNKLRMKLFFDSLFELADKWTDGISAIAYIELLGFIFHMLSKVDQSGKRVFKSMEAVEKDEQVYDHSFRALQPQIKGKNRVNITLKMDQQGKGENQKAKTFSRWDQVTFEEQNGNPINSNVDDEQAGKKGISSSHSEKLWEHDIRQISRVSFVQLDHNQKKKKKPLYPPPAIWWARHARTCPEILSSECIENISEASPCRHEETSYPVARDGVHKSKAKSPVYSSKNNGELKYASMKLNQDSHQSINRDSSLDYNQIHVNQETLQFPATNTSYDPDLQCFKNLEEDMNQSIGMNENNQSIPTKIGRHIIDFNVSANCKTSSIRLPHFNSSKLVQEDEQGIFHMEVGKTKQHNVSCSMINPTINTTVTNKFKGKLGYVNNNQYGRVRNPQMRVIRKGRVALAAGGGIMGVSPQYKIEELRQRNRTKMSIRGKKSNLTRTTSHTRILTNAKANTLNKIQQTQSIGNTQLSAAQKTVRDKYTSGLRKRTTMSTQLMHSSNS